jgi:capsular exopolysaccharide synthesis family protein
MNDHLVSLVDATSFAAEQYRVLAHNVEQMRRDEGLGVVAVTSPGVGDGKTTTSINLAGALAESVDDRVLLVDADLRRASVQEQLGRGNAGHPGIVDAVMDRSLSLRDVVQPASGAGFWLLPAGAGKAVPYDILKSVRFRELMTEARGQFGYVVVDTPPFVPAPDCRAIAKWVDRFLLVVAAHKTPLRLIESALDVMESAQLAGVIFNGSDDRPFSEYYDRYYLSNGNARHGWRSWWKRIAA